MKDVRPIVGVVQARMGSSRLPGKILKSVQGRPLLEMMLRRVTRSQVVSRWVLATTTDPKDDALLLQARPYLDELAVEVHRGSEEDVLQRFADVARVTHARTVIRLTADCPLMDAQVIDDLVDLYSQDHRCLYASNTIQRSYPRGLDVEIFSAELLLRADRLAGDSYEREHVTPWIKKEADLDRIQQLVHSTNESKYRWTVDTAEDLEAIEKVIGASVARWGWDFTWLQALEIARAHPEWLAINSHVEQRSH